MCTVVPWWWLTFLTILLAGAFGGLARYFWEESEGNGREGMLPHIVMGIAASFLVPLFLNSISSSLIEGVPDKQSNLFVLIGFCVAAGSFAKQFIGSVAKKALELSQRANQTAMQAQATASSAETNAKSADNRAIALYKVLRLIDERDFDGAIREIERVVSDDPENAEAWAWKGFCLKRLGRFEDACTAMQCALDCEGREVFPWLYNLACYQCLSGARASIVIETLRRGMKCATNPQLHQLKTDLRGDEDFARLAQDKDLLALINSLGETS